ncbi:MAG: RIP metalloprotease RseP [Prevotella sp.]|nr:RIP metalloprotease RseP [Prevotella sp.]
MEVFLIRLLQFLLSISLLVLLHECGHFFFARLFKVRVSRFYLFFNPKFHIASTYDPWVRKLFHMKPEEVPVKIEKDDDGNERKVKEYVGTEYGLGWLPLGGYCAIDGMVDETNQKLSDDPKPWEFRTKPAWQRLLIMIGGVLVNFLLALFIYSMVLFHWGDSYIAVKDMNMGMKFNAEAKSLGFQDGDILVGTDKKEFKKFDADLFRAITDAERVDVIRDGKQVSIPINKELSLLDMLKKQPIFASPFVPSEVDSVMADSPAAKLGMKKGDKIVAFAGKPVDCWVTFDNERGRLADALSSAKTPADSMKIRQTTVAVEHKATGAIDTMQVTLNPDLSLGIAKTSVLNYYKETKKEYGFFESFPAGISYGVGVLRGYVDDLKYVFTADGAKSLGGFGAIGSLFPAEWDWMMFWRMTAFLSIILAFMNILPIPALDGGHVLFLLWEMITGRKPSDKFMVYAEYIGMGILLLLMVVANLNDILRWIGVM